MRPERRGKKIAEAAARQQIEAMTAEREAAKGKVEEAERQRLAAVTQLATVKAQQDTVVAERTAEVRAAMEKNKADEINTLRAQQASETQKLAEQMAALQRRLDT